MDDETKAAVERFRSIIEEERAQMDAETFAALWGSDAVVLVHLDGEPARIAAKAEEVREACAEAIYRANPVAGACVEVCRATPLTATPLADRIAELEQQKVDLKTMIQGLRGRAEKAEARVAELERALADAVAIAREFDARQQKAERLADQLCAVLGREVGNRGDSEGAVDVAKRLIRERDEAVAALRALLREEWYTYEGNLEAAGHVSVDDLNAARAVLAKYPEGR